MDEALVYFRNLLQGNKSHLPNDETEIKASLATVISSHWTRCCAVFVVKAFKENLRELGLAGPFRMEPFTEESSRLARRNTIPLPNGTVLCQS